MQYPVEFLRAQQLLYDPLGLKVDQFVYERESREYEAATFLLEGHFARFRVAKITPTKVGQFVTLWKREGNGPILPFDLADPVDLFVINVKRNDDFGQFVFPKVLLYEKGFISKGGDGGKRAMRLYPPWDKTDNRQAKATQKWQLDYFFQVPIQVEEEKNRFQCLLLSF